MIGTKCLFVGFRSSPVRCKESRLSVLTSSVLGPGPSDRVDRRELVYGKIIFQIGIDTCLRICYTSNVVVNITFLSSFFCRWWSSLYLFVL